MYGDISFQFVGTCAQDREYFTMDNGQQRASINVAVNVPRKNRDTGDFEQVTTWVRVAIFGDRAQSASVDRCRKGMPVYVRGSIQSYRQEIAGKNYTFYNFRSDCIRPLLSLDQLERCRRIPDSEDPYAPPDPQGDAPASGGSKTSHSPKPAGVPSAEDDYFND